MYFIINIIFGIIIFMTDITRHFLENKNLTDCDMRYIESRSSCLLLYFTVGNKDAAEIWYGLIARREESWVFTRCILNNSTVLHPREDTKHQGTYWETDIKIFWYFYDRQFFILIKSNNSLNKTKQIFFFKQALVSVLRFCFLFRVILVDASSKRYRQNNRLCIKTTKHDVDWLIDFNCNWSGVISSLMIKESCSLHIYINIF